MLCRKLSLLFSLLFFVTACGSDTNLNNLIFMGSDDALDSLLVEAKVKYDQGEFAEAEELALKAWNLDDGNEETAILLGYIYMSQGGIDPFQLARGLIATDDDTTDTQSATGLKEGDSSSDSDSSDILTKLSSLLNVDDDMSKLGTEYGGSGDTMLWTPKIIDETMRNGVNTLNYMNKAINIVCNFVDLDLADNNIVGRGFDSDDCSKTIRPRKQSAKAHFLWAFTHLTEALVFQKVVLFTSAGSSKSNFENRADDLDEIDNISVTAFATKVEEISTAVNTVFNTEDEGSQLVATLAAFEAVEDAFNAISGLSADIVAPITSAMKKIEDATSKISGTSDPDQKGAQAIQGQMNKKIGKTVTTKVNEVVAAAQGEENIPPADKTKLCDSLDVIYEGVPPLERDSNNLNCPGS